MKMIVTGSAGFIGKALCQELRKRAVEVIEIDRVTGQEASTIGEYLKDGRCGLCFSIWQRKPAYSMMICADTERQH